MLKFILMVTMAAHNLSATETAYRDLLGYKVVERGKVSKALAQAWGAPAVAGRKYVLMQPASGARSFLRFVESPKVAGYAPLRTYGWNSTEILVTDPDELAKRLANSPFRIIGPPKNLASNENIRALQVVGPAGEVLYLTRIVPGKGGYNLGSAQSYVDYTFIVVLGGKSMATLKDYFEQQMQMTVTQPRDVHIGVLSDAFGLDAQANQKLALVRFPEKYLIELDEYPAGALERPQRKGDLPPGMAMVTFGVESLDEAKLKFVQAPTVRREKPYGGKRAAVTKGVAGELIELVEK